MPFSIATLNYQSVTLVYGTYNLVYGTYKYSFYAVYKPTYSMMMAFLILDISEHLDGVGHPATIIPLGSPAIPRLRRRGYQVMEVIEIIMYNMCIIYIERERGQLGELQTQVI